MNKTEIILKDGNKYFYTTSSYDIENPLGVIKATLKEYTLYKIVTLKILLVNYTKPKMVTGMICL